jgi:alpha/beta superfamily hydrolase
VKVDFIRFKASDQVELQGWLNNENGDTAVLHIHGRSGNGYENYFLDNLRAMYAQHQISFLTIDTRGRGVISDFRQGNGWKHAGSCFELFEESEADIQGAVNYLKALKKTTIILQGHSLGCTKIVNYLVKKSNHNVKMAILIAPTDMVGWAKAHADHEKYLSKAKKLLSEGKGEQFVDSECWVDKTPISAKTYPTICEAGSDADIYGDREGGPLLGRVKIPMIIPYGDHDIGILRIDQVIGNWVKRVNQIKNKNTQISVISAADHGFRGYETELSKIVEDFTTKQLKV